MPEPDSTQQISTSGASALQELPRKLAHIQSLWQRLLYAKWEPQVLELIRRLVHEILSTARAEEREELAHHARRLEQQLETLKSRPSAPPEAERSQLKGILQNLARAILASQASAQYAVSPPLPQIVMPTQVKTHSCSSCKF